MTIRNIPTRIIVKRPDGTTQEAKLGQISDQKLVAELNKFRDAASRFTANGPIVKLISR